MKSAVALLGLAGLAAAVSEARSLKSYGLSINDMSLHEVSPMAAAAAPKLAAREEEDGIEASEGAAEAVADEDPSTAVRLDKSCDSLIAPFQLMFERCAQNAKTAERLAQTAPKEVMEQHFGRSDKAARDLVSKNFVTLGRECASAGTGGTARLVCDHSDKNLCKSKEYAAYILNFDKELEVLMCPLFFSYFDLNVNDRCVKRGWLTQSAMFLGFLSRDPKGTKMTWDSKDKLTNGFSYVDFAFGPADTGCAK